MENGSLLELDERVDESKVSVVLWEFICTRTI